MIDQAITQKSFNDSPIVFKNGHSDDNFIGWREYAQSANSWRRNAFRMEGARYGEQFSEAEEREIIAFRQAPIPISVSTALLDSADAMATSVNPMVKVSPLVFPFDDKEQEDSFKVSQIYNHAITKDWHDSLGTMNYTRVQRDESNTGHGFMMIVPRFENGKFFVEFKHLTWRYWWGDPASVDPLYRDMDSMFYAFEMSEANGLKYLRSVIPDLTKKQFDDNFQDGDKIRYVGEEEMKYSGRFTSKRSTISFIQRFTLEDHPVYRIVPGETEDLNTRSVAAPYRQIQKSQLTDSIKKLVAQGKIRLIEEKGQFLTTYTSIGGLGFQKVYPIKSYNIVPFVYDHRDTPYPRGRMFYLYPLQRATNKFFMSAILNASLLNSTKVIAEENSIINEKEWQQRASMPGVILKYRLPVPGVSKEPIIVEAKPMSESWLLLPRYLVSMMEYIIGIPPMMQGQTDGAPSVFSTVAMLQSSTNIKVKKRMQDSMVSLSEAGKIAGMFYREYAPLNGFVSYENEEGLQTQVYNKIQMSPDEEGNPQFGVAPETDLRKGFEKIRFEAQGSIGGESATQAMVLSNLASQTKTGGVLLPEILKMMGIPGASKLSERLDENSQLKQSLEQTQQVVKELENRSKQYQNQIFQISVSLEKIRAKGKFDKEVAEIISNLKNVVGE